MSWDISQIVQAIVSALFGAVFGSISGWLASLYLQRKERETRYAIQNRQEIYDPLFDETKRIREELDEFRNPFTASTTLDTWARLKPSIKLRVPDDLKKLIKDFNDAGREFYNAHFMYCLEGNIGPTHLQKVDAVFQALPVDEAAHPGRC